MTRTDRASGIRLSNGCHGGRSQEFSFSAAVFLESVLEKVVSIHSFIGVA